MAKCIMQRQNETVSVTEMDLGDIAQIVSWGSSPDFVSSFVQRCSKYLFVLGSATEYWDDISWGFRTTDQWKNCMVRILDETEVLELRNEKSSK